MKGVDAYFLLLNNLFYIVGRDKSYFVHKNILILAKKFYEADIIKVLQFFIHIFVMLGGHVFQQTVCIPMGNNCIPILADLFLSLYSHEADFRLVFHKKSKKASLIL